MKTLSERDQRMVWHPFTQFATADAPIAIVRGAGACLYDEQGAEYIDAVASWWMNVHGHAHPHLSRCLYEQAQKLEHVIFANFTHAPAVDLAERLLSSLPTQARVFYSDNGSTAVEVGIKMCLQFWHNQGYTARRRLIAFKGAYHGDTFGAMSVGERSAFTRPFESMLFEVSFIEPPQAGKEAESLQQLQMLWTQYGEQLAGFIFEPLIQGAAGMQMQSVAGLDALMQFCRQKGIICIADEVMTGFFRTGKQWATDHCTEKPDIYCLSKGLTGGMFPLGATTCTREIFEAFNSAEDYTKTFFHGHSHTGNPMACALGVASWDLLHSAETQENIQRICAQQEEMRLWLSSQPAAQNARRCGTVLAFEWQPQRAQAAGGGYFSGLKKEIWQFFIGQKLILRPLGNTVYVLPPYCITEEQLQRVYAGIRSLVLRN